MYWINCILKAELTFVHIRVSLYISLYKVRQVMKGWNHVYKKCSSQSGLNDLVDIQIHTKVDGTYFFKVTKVQYW